MNRIDRLFAILLRISDGKLFQAEKLSTEFEISERTIYRDMRALVQMGIPLQAEAGVGYQLKKGYFLPPLIFEKDEAIAIGFALKFLTTYSHGSFNDASVNALRKIESILPKVVRADYDHDLEVLEYSPASSPVTLSDRRLRMIIDAIKHQYLVELEYFSYRREIPEIRQVEPNKLFLVPGRNVWYLKAFCLKRNEWRNFCLDRIHNIKATRTTFLPRNHEETKNANANKAMTKASVFVRPELVRWIRESQHWSVVDEFETPEGLVAWTYQDFEWPSFVAWLCTVNDCLVRLEPEEARAQLEKKISNIRRLLT